MSHQGWGKRNIAVVTDPSGYFLIPRDKSPWIWLGPVDSSDSLFSQIRISAPGYESCVLDVRMKRTGEDSINLGDVLIRRGREKSGNAADDMPRCQARALK